MIYFLALIPATALTIAGYFVLYLSHRSEGGFRAFGKYLGFWAFTLAALVILAAIFASAHAGYRGARFAERGTYGRLHGGPGYFGPRRGGPRWFREPGQVAPQPPAVAPGPTVPTQK